MTADDLLIGLKAGGAALVGSVIALKGIPGTRGQRAISLLCSLGIGFIAGAVAMERYGLAAGSAYHVAAIWAGSVFGLITVNNVATQVPAIVESLRKRWIGDSQDAPKP